MLEKLTSRKFGVSTGIAATLIANSQWTAAAVVACVYVVAEAYLDAKARASADAEVDAEV